MYSVQIDKSLCSGFGSCVGLAPELFELEGPVATVRTDTTDDPSVLDAAASCPMGAIAILAIEAERRAA